MQPVLLLEGKLALVTGAGRGIGRAIAVAYANAGARVVITDLGESACAETRAELEAAGAPSWAFALDVTDVDACSRLAERVQREIGDLQVLVNNAGVMIRETVDSPRVHLPHVRSGKFELLAVFSEERAPAADSVPTMVEALQQPRRTALSASRPGR